MLLFVVLILFGSVCGENSCHTCNCQFNNIQLLTGLIESIVNDTLFTGLLDNIVETLRHQFSELFLYVCVCVCVFVLISSYALGSGTWTPVIFSYIGSANFYPAPSTFHFQIPSVIPHTAREFLLYAYIDCGSSVNDIVDDIVFYVEHGGMRFEKFLRVHSWSQNAWNTNSDNMWFPMPANKQVHLDVVQVTIPYCFARLYAIGYR